MERIALISPLGFGTPSSIASGFDLRKSVIVTVKEGELS